MLNDFQEGDEHRCGKLNLWLYGMRPAATGWEKLYSDYLCDDEGFVRGVAFPNVFYNTEKIFV